MSDYTIHDPVPGSFDHRSDDCETHGVNVVFFRAKKALGPFFCVRCAREAMSRKYDQELATDAD